MATQDSNRASDLGDQAIALAEQIGRTAGMIQGTAEAWLNRQQAADQLTRIRDRATEMLKSLRVSVPGGKASTRANTRPAARSRQASPAHAPGKRRRKPAPRKRGVKKSNQTIPKMRTSKAVRQRRKSYA